MTNIYLLGIDQGTSGSRALVLNGAGDVCGYAYRPVPAIHPQPEWTEQDPYEVADGVAAVITEAVTQAGVDPAAVVACGITCQRNTDFVWHAQTGRPLANAITWQDLRTRSLLAKLEQWPLLREARTRLGYAPGTYMTALHLGWRMAHETAVAQAAQSHQLRVGLSAAWLIQALGRPYGHQMDRSLVQATGLYDFRRGDYWQPWLERLGVPRSALPQPVPTLHPFGTLRVSANGRAADVPVRAMIGDQQAALFGHGCTAPGDAETTHGTASYLKVFLGCEAPLQDNVNVYYAWDVGEGQTYCLEAPTTVIGAALRWMRDQACFLRDYQEIETLAKAVSDSGGVVFVPAFTGLDAPYNDPGARATLIGMTLGTTRAHIVRAFLEGLAYQLRAIQETIARDAGIEMRQLLVGGGVSASDTACQLQADVLGIPVIRPSFTETTARAAALLAGLATGVWPTVAALPPLPGSAHRFTPAPFDAAREQGYGRFQQAIALTRQWSKEVGE